MTVDNETTRTPATESGDAAAHTQTAAATTQDERTAPSQDAGKDEHDRLQNKLAAEKLNRLKARLGVTSDEELEAMLSTPPAETGTATSTTVVDEEAEDERVLREYADKGDPVAKATLREMQRRRELTGTIGTAFGLRDIEDKTERAETFQHMQRARRQGRNLDLPAARAEVRLTKAEQEAERLRAELAQLKKQPDPNVMRAPATHGNEGPPRTGTKRRMTTAAFDSEVERLHRAGDSFAAMDLQRAYRDGDIELTDG